MDKPFFGHDLWTFLSFHIVKVTTYEAEMSRNYLMTFLDWELILFEEAKPSEKLTKN